LGVQAILRQFAKRTLSGAAVGLSRTPVGVWAYQQLVDIAMTRERTVEHRGLRMRFAVPNPLTEYRIDTFATKEPETLEWLEAIPRGSVLWDVGANVGLYSIYAALARDCRVYAFEPSVFNLELLARNVFLNRLQERITLVPLALSDRLGSNAFKMTTTAWGGALSTFGEDIDQNGARLNGVFEYATVGMSMNDAVRLLGIPQPGYVKIDVDGIEHFILRGAAEVLAGADSVLVEINDAFTEQAQESARRLDEAGLALARKCDLGVPGCYNQWWSRSAAKR
jgi:FkbM family methyltransferase